MYIFTLHNLTNQFAPFNKEINDLNKTFENLLTKKSMGKTIVESFKEGFKGAGKILKGAYLSMPKPVRMIGVDLIALTSLKYHLENQKIETKYDTVQYLKDQMSAE